MTMICRVTSIMVSSGIAAENLDVRFRWPGAAVRRPVISMTCLFNSTAGHCTSKLANTCQFTIGPDTVLVIELFTITLD